MRCTRCDSPAVPLSLGRLRDGRLVFGWCRECLVANGCESLDEGPEMELVLNRSQARRRRRTARRARAAARSPEEVRRLILRSIAQVLALWALLLAVAGGFLVPGPSARPTDPVGNGARAFLLVGSGVMLVIALVLGFSARRTVRGRRPTPRRLVPIVSTLMIVVVLVWGIGWHKLSRDPWIVAIVALVLLASVLSRRADSRGRVASPESSEQPL